MAKGKADKWGGSWVVGGLLIVAVLAGLQIWVVRNAMSQFGIEPNLLGDSFGAMNAVISALAFVAFIITLLLQRRELKLQREELEETRRELRGSRRAQESQAQMGLQSARIAALGAILNHKYHEFARRTSSTQQQAVNIEMNRWNAELEAEITAIHYIGQPWQAANAMLHQATIELQNARTQATAITFPLTLPGDLPQNLEEAQRCIDGLLDEVHRTNSATGGRQFSDIDDR